MRLPFRRHAKAVGRELDSSCCGSIRHGILRVKPAYFSRKAAQERSPRRKPWGKSQRMHKPRRGERVVRDAESIDHPARDRGVAVDPPVAQERPVPADVFQLLQIDFTNQNLFFVMRSLGDHSAERIT